MKKIISSIVGLVAMSGVAEAHTGHGTTGFMHGFSHPFTGIDHISVMIAVGLFAAMLGGRARYLLPMSFVAMMTVGAALAMNGFVLPFVEIGIAASIIVLVGVVAMRWNASLSAATALCGFFAVFHGFAHGAEMPVDASGLSYGLGFVVATVVLHAIGLASGMFVGLKVSQKA